MGKPQHGPSVSYETYRKYVKNQHQKWKKETQKPEKVAARNFAAEQVRKDAEPKVVAPRNFAEEHIRRDVEAKASDR